MFERRVDESIEIRQFESRDAAAVFAAADRNREYLREWLPWVDATQSVEDVRAFILRALAQYHSHQGPNAGIWLHNELAGSIGCHHIDWVNRACSIGYWVDRARQGEGIVTRCCANMLDYLFTDPSLHRVVIQCGIGNTKSAAVPARLGFTHEGVSREAQWVNGRWVDLEVWSMLEEQWRARR